MEVYSETKHERRKAKAEKPSLAKKVRAFFEKSRGRVAQSKEAISRAGSEAKRTGADFFSEIKGKSVFQDAVRPEAVREEIGRKVDSVRRMSARSKRIFAVALGVFAVLVCVGVFNSFRASYKDVSSATFISKAAQKELDLLLDEAYEDRRTEGLKSLPYPFSPVSLDVWSGSAILIDAANGCVLFEKNADAPIPPASIAKIFVMYIALKDVHEGKVSLDDIVPLPEKSWAVNMPRDASLMFLGQGQIVTLRELLLGLAVASGNDAAIAVARYISGGTEEFVRRMNEECAALGLLHTHFVEPSGYDENNMTTARELAAFARVYINAYPESIAEFHSKRSIRYPLEKNLPSWQKEAGDSKAIYQKNTNPLLGEMEGADGIKTGFIYESGYNLALTASRDGNRFISITLQGPGRGSKQGNEGRVHDGHEMMDFAFGAFADYDPKKHVEQSFPVAVPGGAEKFVRLVPAWTNAITVPHIAGGKSAGDDANSVQAVVTIPKSIYAETTAAKQYGQIQYTLGDVVLETVPLVADRTIPKGSLWRRFWGFWI